MATLSFLFEPIQQLSQLYTTYQSGMAALEKIFQLLDVKPELEDRPAAPDLPHIEGEISFEDISFAYKRRRGLGAEGNGDGGPPPLPLTGSTSMSRQARRSHSSAPPARASRRWPSWWPASMTRPRVAC